MSIHIYRSELEPNRWFKVRDTKTDFEYYAKYVRYVVVPSTPIHIIDERLIIVRDNFCSSGETFSKDLIFPLIHSGHLLVQQRNWEVEYLNPEENLIIEERFQNSNYAKL